MSIDSDLWMSMSILPRLEPQNVVNYANPYR